MILDLNRVFHVEHHGRWLNSATNALGENLINCYITDTTCKSHKIINDNLHLSPLYKGDIGTGLGIALALKTKL